MPLGEFDEILHHRTLTSTVTNFRFGQLRFQQILNKGARRTQSGDTVKWDILKPSRYKAKFNAPGAPSKRVKMEKAASRTARCLRVFNHKLLSGDALANLREPGTERVNARARVASEQLELTRENRFLREWALAQMIGVGIMTISDDEFIDTIDYGVSATHKPTAVASWAVTGTDIPTDILTWKALIQQDSGFTPARAIANDSVLKYLLKNTAVKNWCAAGTAITEQIARSGNILQFMGLTWEFYNAGYLNSSDVFTEWVADNTVLILPAAGDDSWYDMQEGSTKIPDEGKENLVDAYGMFSYSEIISDPPALKIYEGDTFLPLMHVPDAVVIADVVP